MHTRPADFSAHFWLAPPLLAALPLAAHLPGWLSLACVLLWGWRLALALRGRRLPPVWLRVILALAAVGAILLHYGLTLGRTGGVPLLTLLMFVKLLESDSLRHRRFSLLLAYFVLLGVFLYEQSLPMTLYVLAAAWLNTAALVQLAQPGEPELRAPLLTAGRLLAAGAPLALALFVFFPRLPAPLWLLPNGERTARTGLADTMQPGDISRLILSDEIALRARFHGPAPPQAQLYWRGPVLTHFDGRAWRALPAGQMQAPAQGLGAALAYTLTVEPHERLWLFALGLPAVLPPETRLAEGMQLTSTRPLTQRRRLELRSHPRYRLGATHAELAAALQLPPGYNPRARALAQRWRTEVSGAEQLVARALALFRRDFTYTLLPPPLGAHSVDEFLFDTRRGFCEHYAGAFVFLMRAAGVPARVVTGYLGGEYNPLDEHWVVRQSDAHAWAEVWLGPTQGWVSVDPTASVAPSRVERGLAAALPAVELPAALAGLQRPWLKTLRQSWEALNNGWNQWVLGYDSRRQMDLLARLDPRLIDRAWPLAIAVLLTALAIMAALAWRGGHHAARDEAARLFGYICARLARLGLPRAPAEAPMEYARRVAAARPDLAAQVAQLCARYERARYAQDGAALSALAREVRRFRPSRRRFR